MILLTIHTAEILLTKSTKCSHLIFGLIAYRHIEVTDVLRARDNNFAKYCHDITEFQNNLVRGLLQNVRRNAMDYSKIIVEPYNDWQ